ncbi:PilZ domain-containing protein [Stenotrophomonas sp.]|uniref:PilZ domain-containing protein n=1 Tax=Stenotrophomonas sp. TaxID=69392 RepID=UPI0028AE0814|nr:PilZ domain-containing protein [Stenotrophomonas sp.]
MTEEKETRRARRRRVTEQITVTDMLAEAVIGRLVNVSETGMLMMAAVPMQDDALYQFRFAIPGPGGQPVALDVGAHLLWHEQSNAPGQDWIGFRFLTLSKEHRELLKAWVEQETSAT